MKNRIEFQKFLLAIVVVTLLVSSIIFIGMFLLSSNVRDNASPAKQEEMMGLVLAWGRLAPFPATATDVTITTDGNSFTRSFHASFIAPNRDIKVWIEDSPGLNEILPEKISENKEEYKITPGGGANIAEVVIDYDLGKVEIYVSWS